MIAIFQTKLDLEVGDFEEEGELVIFEKPLSNAPKKTRDLERGREMKVS